MQNRHSMSLGIHFHILRCSSLYSQPQPEHQQQPEKAPGWQKEPVPEPAPAPASGKILVLSGLGGCKFPRKHHHPAGTSQTHHSPRRAGLGGVVRVGRGRQCPVAARLLFPSPHSPAEPASPAIRPLQHGCSWCPAGQSCPWSLPA